MNPTLHPIAFLDLDDVLCLNTTVGGYDAILAVNGRHANPAAVYRDLFDPGARGVLERVHDAFAGELRYVVSSTWRESLGREQMATVFKASGLGFVAEALEPGERWCTPAKLGRRRRADEIAAWLDQHHCGEPFVIVDDTYSGASLEPALMAASHPFHGRVVLCRETEGLLDHHAQVMVDALRHVVEAALRLKPMAVVLLGDTESPRALHLELEPIRELVWWIHGNHDTGRQSSWSHLVDSELADRQLDGRVVTLADGTRLAGLGGVFRGSIWMPPEPPVHENYDAWLASCQWRRAPVHDTEKLKHRSSIFEDSYLALMTQQADILVTHEAGSSHPHGHAAIDELAQSMGVQASFHGHHHMDYSGRWTELGFKAFGVGLRGICDRAGRVVAPGEKDEMRAGRRSQE